MTHDAPAYGLWGLVVLNAALFIAFAYSFAKPRTGVDWRSFGAFTANLLLRRTPRSALAPSGTPKQSARLVSSPRLFSPSTPHEVHDA